MYFRTFTAVLGAVAMSAVLVGAQEKSSTPSTNTTATAANTVTFTGCLNSGSGKDVYYLISAKQKGAKTQEKTLKVLQGSEKASLERYLSQEVELTGTVDPAQAPAATTDGAAPTRTLTVTKAKFRAQSCG
jgi:hypothetical protein